MNRIKNSFIILLVFILIFSTVGISDISNVNASELKDKNVDFIKEKKADFNQVDSDFVILEDGILIEGEFYSPEEFEEYLKSSEVIVLNDGYIDDGSLVQPFFALAPAIYLVPGVGQVALLATGGIVIGGVTIAAGSWLYKTISKFFNNPKNVIASNYGIPKSLLNSNGDVKLGSFKDKHGNTPLNKSSGTFKNGKWSVDKDTAGHGGRAWKLKKDNKRKASLDKNGKVLSK